MPTLEQLRNKWFLDFDSPGSTFPPVRRYEGSSVSNYTDGNLVTPLVDGKNYMQVWHDSIRAMISQPNCEVYHSSWALERVRTLGNTVASSDNLQTLDDADNGGVTLYLMISRHFGGLLPIWSALNLVSVDWLRIHGIWTATMDNRFPNAGSNHHKVTCLKNPADVKAVLGSIDISPWRWDSETHSPENAERTKQPTHDIGVQVQGPAVADIEQSFRDRWNDSSRSFGLEPVLPPLPLIISPISAPTPVGTHSVQVLHTYGRTSSFFGYSWSPAGDFTVWASYLNAIRRASNYIYIEDQYFYPFDWPPCLPPRTGVARDSDLVYQLGEAIKRGCKVAVLVPVDTEDPLRAYQKYQRDIGVNYLATIASSNPGDFVIASLHNGTSPVYVHSKIMICDDEFVLVGSANIGQRSMTHDGELHLGIVDGGDSFAREFRKKLWAEHLERLEASLDDPIVAYATFKADTAASRGRVRPYSTAHPGKPRPGHANVIRWVVDPYAGPPRL